MQNIEKICTKNILKTKNNFKFTLIPNLRSEPVS